MCTCTCVQCAVEIVVTSCCVQCLRDSVCDDQLPHHSFLPPQLDQGSTVSTPLNSPLLPQTVTKFQLDSLGLLLLVSRSAGLPRTYSGSTMTMPYLMVLTHYKRSLLAPTWVKCQLSSGLQQDSIRVSAELTNVW